MRKLTAEEIVEPDVILTIHPDRLALEVSKELEDLLRLYGRCTLNEKGHLVFSDRYREQIELLLDRESHDSLTLRKQLPSFLRATRELT
jgi:hypothetical protein